MLRFAWLALVASIVLPVTARAQAAPATQQGFGFCTVTDTSSAQAKIWASMVFPLEYPGDDPAGFQRGMAVAGEFLAHVGTQGGRGDKSCIVVSTQGEAARFREEQRAIWDKRVYFIKIGDWRDVAWTPAPWKPGQAAANAASVTRYFLCQATQTDIPDRSDRSRSVASGVFAMPVPGNNALSAGFEQSKAYAAEFQSVVRAHGLPVQGDCMSYDTRDEAQYAYQQMLRLLKGFNQKYSEVAWTPTGRAPVAIAATSTAPSAGAPAGDHANLPSLGLFRIDPMTPALSESIGLPSPQGVLISAAGENSGFRHLDALLEIAGQSVNAPKDVAGIVARLRPGFQAPVRIWRERKVQDISIVIPQQAVETTTATVNATPQPSIPATPATSPAEQALYCTGFVMRTKPALTVRVPVRKEASPSYNQTTATATLTTLVSAVQQAHPGDWQDLSSHIGCYDNSGVIAGEKFCVVSSFKRFGGGMQTAGLFCNASRELIDKRWDQMVKADGGHAQIFPW